MNLVVEISLDREIYRLLYDSKVAQKEDNVLKQ